MKMHKMFILQFVSGWAFFSRRMISLSDSEIGNPLLPLFYMHHDRQDSTYHGLCYTSREALAGRPNESCVDNNNNINIVALPFK